LGQGGPSCLSVTLSKCEQGCETVHEQTCASGQPGVPPEEVCVGAHMAGFTDDGDGAVEGKRDRLRFVQLFAIWCAWPRTQCI